MTHTSLFRPSDLVVVVAGGQRTFLGGGGGGGGGLGFVPRSPKLHVSKNTPSAPRALLKFLQNFAFFLANSSPRLLYHVKNKKGELEERIPYVFH